MMPVIYEDALFVVRQSWLGPWRVVDKSTGATIAPELRLQEQVGYAWRLIRKHRLLDPVLRRFSEDVLMQTFALASIYPAHPFAGEFCEMSADSLADAIIAEATLRLEKIEPSFPRDNFSE